MLKRIVYSVLILCSVVVIFSGCGGKKTDKKSIQIKGSDTIVNLVQRLAETHMQENPDVSIAVTGGGSGTGIASLINGQTDIANCSRPMREGEIEQAKSGGNAPLEIVIGMDGLALIVQRDSQINSLTLDQTGKIFRGEIENWREVGGKDLAISLYGRQSNSGTFEYFRDRVLKGDYSPEMKRMNGNAQIVEAVRREAAAIGYVGVGYVADQEGRVLSGIKILSLAADSQSEPVNPLDSEKVKQGIYPLTRPLFQYLSEKPEGALLDFIKFELSPRGQNLIKKEGFYPVTDEYKQSNSRVLGE